MMVLGYVTKYKSKCSNIEQSERDEMKFTIEAACSCNKGKIRKNNEDNFYFDGKCLEVQNEGLRHSVEVEERLKNGWCVAVFDGMGGENYGEYASFAAARELQQMERKLAEYFIPEKKYLNRMAMQLNEAVVHAARELKTERMGSTMAALYFMSGSVYVCNLGDSRAYRLRDGEFLQLSQDHVEARPQNERKKAPLTQHLGIDPEYMLIEPYIAKGDIKKGDQYLLCSDGLTDMLTNFEISDIMLQSDEAASCVDRLIEAALEHGGRDNITAIVCRIS